MSVKVGFFLCIILIAASAFLFLSCPAELDAPLPGDSDYIPPDWTDPVLFYDAEDYFPSEVTEHKQAPGQYANDETYGIEGNTDLLLGAPAGAGTQTAGNSSIVSLGMAGGYVVVKFEPPIENHTDNIGGYDLIVFGNSIWFGGDPESSWQEPGTIWVMKDENSNGNPDDTWYLIPGSHLSAGDLPQTLIYNDTDNDAGWWPAGVPSPMSFSGVVTLPDTLYETAGAGEQCWGYGDAAPAMLLGDLSGADGGDGDNSTADDEDYPGIDPVYFYTTPDTPGDLIIDAGSGGGNAIDIGTAVDPAGYTAAGLDQIDWVKIVSGTIKKGSLGEYSTEVDAVARVRRSN